MIPETLPILDSVPKETFLLVTRQQAAKGYVIRLASGEIRDCPFRFFGLTQDGFFVVENPEITEMRLSK